MARQSAMTGWKLAEIGEMVMKKVGTDTPYTLPDLPKADSKSPTEFIQKYRQVGTLANERR